MVALSTDLTRPFGHLAPVAELSLSGELHVVDDALCRAMGLPAESHVVGRAPPIGQPQPSYDVDVPTQDAPVRSARRTVADQVAAEHGLAELLALLRGGASLSTVAVALNRQGFTTSAGPRWHRASPPRDHRAPRRPQSRRARLG